MNVDLVSAVVDEESARAAIRTLLVELATARQDVELATRRVAALRKFIDGLVHIYPTLESALPEDFRVEAHRAGKCAPRATR